VLFNMGLWRIFVVLAVLLSAGCSSSAGPTKKQSSPWFESAKDRSLRKQVEADSFPSANQAGL
jgi:hypothetical protein